MMNGRLRFFVERSFQRGSGCAIFFGATDQPGEYARITHIPEPIQYRERAKDDAASAVGPPPFELSEEEATQLLEELWRAGYRPRKEVGTEGVVKAMHEHISDLRMVSKTLLLRDVRSVTVDATNFPYDQPK